MLRKVLCALLAAGLPTALGAQSEAKRPAITRIAHMTVYATDVDAARRFYNGELGFIERHSEADGKRFFLYASPKQYVVVEPLPSVPTNSRLKSVYFATTDAEALKRYLKAHSITVPDTLDRDPDGTLSFEVKDPEGNMIGFEQAGANRHIPPPINPTSTRIIHVGIAVKSQAAEDAFYRDLLGFRPYWHGAMKEGAADDWVSQQVPDGSDWLEYMLTPMENPSQRQLGVMNHFSLGVVDINGAAARLEAHGWHETPGEHRQDGKDGKRQLNVFDPDLTRVEFMEFSNFREPCCSAFTAANPKP